MNRNKNKERNSATSRHQLLRGGALVWLSVLLVACTSNRIVVTSDDSVDYKSAKSLPTLIKPEDLPAEPNTPTQVEQSVVQVEEVVAVKPTIVSQPDSVASEDIQLSEPSTEPVYEDTTDVELDPQTTKGISVVSSDIVTQGATTRLRIDSDWDAAWDYLVDQLNSSGLTVFSRNKTAGRIAIGCGQIGDEVKVTRSGGWSIFNRKSVKASEYCSLQMKDKGDTILVSVLDRAGNEAPQQEGQVVLSGLTTN